MIKANTIDDYIDSFPVEVKQKLEQIRTVIRKAAPKATEVISYGMPAFKGSSVLVYFAAYKNHIGFYPTSSGIAHFKKEISIYKNSKGAVQFPINEQIPVKLIEKIVKFRMKEDEEKSSMKK